MERPARDGRGLRYVSKLPPTAVDEETILFWMDYIPTRDERQRQSRRRKAKIIVQRYCLPTLMSRASIGREIGVTSARVHQLESAGLRLIRLSLFSHHHGKHIERRLIPGTRLHYAIFGENGERERMG